MQYGIYLTVFTILGCGLAAIILRFHNAQQIQKQIHDFDANNKVVPVLAAYKTPEYIISKKLIIPTNADQQLIMLFANNSRNNFCIGNITNFNNNTLTRYTEPCYVVGSLIDRYTIGYLNYKDANTTIFSWIHPKDSLISNRNMIINASFACGIIALLFLVMILAACCSAICRNKR